MDIANIAPRKVFRAKKTLRVSDRKQWEALIRIRPPNGSKQPFRDCDHLKSHLKGTDAEDVSKHNEHFISNCPKNDISKPELNQSLTFHCKNDVVKAKFKHLSDICVTENQLENARLKSQEDIQSNDHPYPQQKEHQNIGSLRKPLKSSSETIDQNLTATNGSVISCSTSALKEDFSRTSKTHSMKIPAPLDQKNCVTSISVDKKWNIEPVLHVIGVEDLKFVSSDVHDKTSNLKKINHSISPISEKMSSEVHQNLMCNVHLSALHISHNVTEKVKGSVLNERQKPSVSKYLHVEDQSQIDESKLLIDYQEQIECNAIILMDKKSSVLRKRTHSSGEERSSNKRVKTSEGDKSDHLKLTSKSQSAETTKKKCLYEIQKLIHQKIATELRSDDLDNKLEELTKRIENIECRQNHEELAKTIQIRIKRLERKVKAALKTVNMQSRRKTLEESNSTSFSLKQPDVQPVPQHATTGENSTNTLKPGSVAEHMDISATPATVPDRSSQTLTYKKLPDSSNYELSFQLPERTSNFVLEDEEITWNIPLPKNLDIVTPASTHYSDISNTTQSNAVSPDTLTLQCDDKGQTVDAEQRDNLISTQIVIDLTEDDEQYIDNQVRKKGGPLRGNSVMTKSLKLFDLIMDQRRLHSQVSMKCTHPLQYPGF
ncbi:activating transcription factor 7-interacting protein 2-like isoform X2 [Rhincodon typus]|uniref:activating transcription factor 7-interacting protein 2-like isoform X2 n=1 Tax=Rhincodon typus TaxID=259920 RepID=UPI002030C111|nr:activating transcription factor 7-interacting protein 2-like isoform X2 [Rhincodon typus]